VLPYLSRISQIFPTTSNQTRGERNLYTSTKVYKGTYEKIKMEDSKPMKTPIHASCTLSKDESGKLVD